MVDENHEIGSVPSSHLNPIQDRTPEYGDSARVQFGRPIPAQQQLLLYSADEWEEFVLEWVHSQRPLYLDVRRFSGANDMGIDIAGLTNEDGLIGVWDNFQCKHYSGPLAPATAGSEIAKIVWHSFNQHFTPPRKYYFIAPKGCGTSLTKLLSNAESLREYVIENWASCSKNITSTKVIPLEDDFKNFVESFDFTIFSARTALELIDDHRKTPYHVVRFGGGLPDRPSVPPPPDDIAIQESRYIKQLFSAYSDHLKLDVADLSGLESRRDLIDHFHHQREFFYHAEALRNFARDTVPSGTFEDLQSEVHAGVVDVETKTHDDALVRLNAVTQAASIIQLTANALISVVKVQDRKGICHQLANEDRLHWKRE